MLDRCNQRAYNKNSKLYYDITSFTYTWKRDANLINKKDAVNTEIYGNNTYSVY